MVEVKKGGCLPEREQLNVRDEIVFDRKKGEEIKINEENFM
jgi:hypothetical protein